MGRGGGPARGGEPQPTRPWAWRSRRSRRWSPTRTSTTCSSTPSSSASTPRSGSEEEQDYLGLPGLLEPDQVATLLHERQAKQSRAATSRGGAPAPGPPVSAHRALASQRKELNKLVAAYSSKTGAPHASIHMDLRRACGGPELAAATSEQVTERIARIRRWFVGRR